MENKINATEKATFYLTELSAELAELFIEQKYLNHYESIHEEDENGDIKYRDYIQDEFNETLDRIEDYLHENKLD